MNVLIIGGNRFFGKRLAKSFLKDLHTVTLLNRGTLDDDLGSQVHRIKCDREDQSSLLKAVEGKTWDIVYDQVCYEYSVAKASCQAFAKKTKRYIFTSSQSVYKIGANLSEIDFDPSQHKIKKLETRTSDYSEAKRQAEVAFLEHASFPVASVRFPFVLGPDDFTERFKFHVDRIKNGKPIYFPNINAKFSLVTSEFAAEALKALSKNKFEGALNVASPSPISLRDFIGSIENAKSTKAVLPDQPTEDSQSPYGVDDDWFMNCEKLKTECGMIASEISEWLPQLLKNNI